MSGLSTDLSPFICNSPVSERSTGDNAGYDAGMKDVSRIDTDFANSPLVPVGVALIAALRQTPALRSMADEVEAIRARD